MNFVVIDYDYLDDLLVHNIDCLIAIGHMLDSCLLVNVDDFDVIKVIID